VIALLAAAAMVVSTGGTPVQSADRLVNEGIELADHGAYEDAIAKFRAAEEVLPRALNDCNIGLAYARLEKPAEAWFYLQRCKARKPEPDPPWLAARLEKARAALDGGRFAPVDLTAEPADTRVVAAAFLPDDLTAVTPVWLPLGRWELVATRPDGVTEARTLTLETGGPAKMHVVVADPTPPPAPTPTPAHADVRLAVGICGSPWNRTVAGKVPVTGADRSFQLQSGGGGVLVEADADYAALSGKLSFTSVNFGKTKASPSDAPSTHRDYQLDSMSRIAMMAGYRVRVNEHSAALRAGVESEHYASSDPDFVPSYSTAGVALEVLGTTHLKRWLVDGGIGYGLVLARSEPHTFGASPQPDGNFLAHLVGTWPENEPWRLRIGFQLETRGTHYVGTTKAPAGFEVDDAHVTENLQIWDLSLVRAF
jgi:hypothetical protein